VQLIVVKLLLLNPTLVLIVEVVVVLKILLGKDIEELRVHRVGVAQSLNGGDSAEILEEEVSVGEERHLNSTEGESLGIFRRDVLLVISIKGAQSLEDVLIALPKSVVLAPRKNYIIGGKQ
jgi:hypothetical protein